MNDKDHAEYVQHCTTKLNLAITEAARDGLVLEVTVTEIHRADRRWDTPRLDVWVARPVTP